MQVKQVNPNGVKFSIPQGVVTISGPYANGLRLLKKNQWVGMAIFLEEELKPQAKAIEAPPTPSPAQSSDDDSSSSPSLGGAKPLNGE